MKNTSTLGVLALVLVLVAGSLGTFASDCCAKDASCCVPEASCCE